MAKRKYTKFREEPVAYECTNRKCKWQGLDEEKERKRVSNIVTKFVCPDCGKDEFYGLVEYERKD